MYIRYSAFAVYFLKYNINSFYDRNEEWKNFEKKVEVKNIEGEIEVSELEERMEKMKEVELVKVE